MQRNSLKRLQHQGNVRRFPPVPARRCQVGRLQRRGSQGACQTKGRCLICGERCATRGVAPTCRLANERDPAGRRHVVLRDLRTEAHAPNVILATVTHPPVAHGNKIASPKIAAKLRLDFGISAAKRTGGDGSQGLPSMPAACRSCADAQWRYKPPEAGDDAERRHLAGPGILRGGNAFDRKAEARACGIDLDAVRVASTAGSAQISSSVRSGPTPARASAAATLTLAGKPRAPSRAVPSKTLSGSFSPSSEMPRATR